MDLSRSAYYKYKDYVFPFLRLLKEKLLALPFQCPMNQVCYQVF